MKFINKNNGKTLINTRLDTTLIHNLKRDKSIKEEKCFAFNYDITAEVIRYKINDNRLVFDMGTINITKDNLLIVECC